MLKRLFQEPLTHFLALALAIFVLFGALNRSEEPAPDLIVVTGAKIEQLTGLFAKARQRTPTAAEIKGLIDDHIREEILYREALTLGLDKDDTVIRRRLRLKMEFLNQAEADGASPTEAELETYLKANPARFEIDPQLAFRQVFLSPERRGDMIDRDAAAMLEALRSNTAADPVALGDATMLPFELPLTSKLSIAQIFGTGFAEALAKAEPGAWTGPIRSSFGAHLVNVGEHRPGRAATLAEARDAVLREWTNERRQRMEDQRLAARLQRYKVRIEMPQPNLAEAERAP